MIRSQIEYRLSGYVPSGRVELANLAGPMSPELRAALAMPGQQAAVLIGLVERPAGLQVVLTLRASHLSHHPGQVSFPGGRLDRPDESPVEAALREASEEIGLGRGDVTVATTLAPHVTGTGFCVTPVVGFIGNAFTARPDPAEVEQVFEVPLDFALDPRNYTLNFRERFGTRFRSYELQYGPHLIWGATAAILVTFREILI